MNYHNIQGMDKIKLKQAQVLALKHISRYSRTSFEIEQKLLNKGLAKDVVKQAIANLTSQGYLNDQKYLSLWLEFQLKNRPCGRFLCYKKLIQKGLPKNLVEQKLDQEYPLEKEKYLASLLAKQKLKDLKQHNTTKIMRKIKSHLSSKGFPDDIIISIFENWGYLN